LKCSEVPEKQKVPLLCYSAIHEDRLSLELPDECSDAQEAVNETVEVVLLGSIHTPNMEPVFLVV
jgi:hypothetical protein